MNKNEKLILYTTTIGLIVFVIGLIGFAFLFDKLVDRVIAIEHKQMHTSTTTIK